MVGTHTTKRVLQNAWVRENKKKESFYAGLEPMLSDNEVVVAGVACRRCRAGYAYLVVCSGWSGRAYGPAE